MTERKAEPNELTDLRQQAEARLLHEGTNTPDVSPEQAEALFQELRTHQIELEMQNDELRRTQGDLIEARDRFANLYNFAPAGYLTVNEKGLIVEANITFAVMVEMERRSLIKQPLSAFVDARDQDNYYYHRRGGHTTREREPCELRMVRANGEMFWAKMEYVVAEGPAGEAELRYAIGDITQRKRVEEELAKHREHLEDLVRDRTAVIEAQSEKVLEVSRLKSEFLAAMSHELRTPLNSILTLSQLMLSGGTGRDPAKGVELLRVIERNGRQLLNLINDILDLSSIEDGKIRISPTEFGPCHVVERALSTVGPLAKAKGLALETHLADIPLMFSDEERIGQIMINLLGNAVKFTDVGQITITLTQADGMVSFTVTDTGIGISPDDLTYVFDKFRQADMSNSRRHQGTGLGLAISQNLAKLLGGLITVTSDLDKGSTFTLTLPTRLADAVQAEAEEPPPGAEKTTGVTGTTNVGLTPSTADRKSPTGSGAILVVEDNPDNLLATTAILDRFGYRHTTAVSGELAIAAASVEAPALILMDIQLPVMDGLEATRQIRANPALKDIPVVALTARAMKGDREIILAAGCDDYLSKPIDPDPLRKALRKWLN